jgi:hypothetical protein
VELSNTLEFLNLVGVVTDKVIKEYRYDKVVSYESRKREVKIRLLNEGRYDERLQGRIEESTVVYYKNRENEN